jgi:hypothetical protein
VCSYRRYHLREPPDSCFSIAGHRPRSSPIISNCDSAKSRRLRIGLVEALVLIIDTSACRPVRFATVTYTREGCPACLRTATLSWDVRPRSNGGIFHRLCSWNYLRLRPRKQNDWKPSCDPRARSAILLCFLCRSEGFRSVHEPKYLLAQRVSLSSRAEPVNSRGKTCTHKHQPAHRRRWRKRASYECFLEVVKRRVLGLLSSFRQFAIRAAAQVQKGQSYRRLRAIALGKSAGS